MISLDCPRNERDRMEDLKKVKFLLKDFLKHNPFIVNSMRRFHAKICFIYIYGDCLALVRKPKLYCLSITYFLPESGN